MVARTSSPTSTQTAKSATQTPSPTRTALPPTYYPNPGSAIGYGLHMSYPLDEDDLPLSHSNGHIYAHTDGNLHPVDDSHPNPNIYPPPG